MRLRLTGIATVLAIAGAVLLIGCKEEGPAEKAGQKLDQAAEEATDAVEEAGDELEEAADDLGKSFDTGG